MQKGNPHTQSRASQINNQNFIDPHTGLINEVDEIQLVQENLDQIEAILKAESKRRMEANQITEEYIKNYLDGLEKNLTQRVNAQFSNLDKKITHVDKSLHNIERQFNNQDTEIQR